MRTASTSLTDSVYSLEPDAQLEMFKLTLVNNAEMYFSKDVERTWLGNTYAEVPCHMTAVSQTTDGTKNRPKFTFANPSGVFSSDIMTGELDNAVLERQQIMLSDLQADYDIAIRSSFRITKILSLTKDSCSVELKSALDGHSFTLPARHYYPPEFPHVKLR
jgi:phage-related protein